MASCPACGRGVAHEGERCLYCGAPLGPAATPKHHAEPRGTLKPDAPPRLLVLVDLGRSEPQPLAQALRVSHYEAALLVRRGGLHLARAGAPAGKPVRPRAPTCCS